MTTPLASAVSDEELVSRYPGRRIDHDNRAIYRGWLERRLLVNRCRACGRWDEPPHPVCPACWSSEVVATEVSGTGTIFMFVLLHQGPPAEGVDYATPYPVVTVELDEAPGVRISSTIIGAPNDEVAIGRRVLSTGSNAQDRRCPCSGSRVAHVDKRS